MIKKKPNIVWFMIDSLRPDFLAAFGADYEPLFLDGLIKTGVSFSQCITAAPYTIASENAMFTAFYPSVNKLNGWFKNTPENLDRKVVTFSDILKNQGYYTACFFPSAIRAYLPPYSFDWYEMVDNTDQYPIDVYLSAQSPRFLVLEFDEIHDACCAVGRGEYSKKKYREALRTADEKIKYFYETFCGPGDVIVISSDHGVRVIDEPSNDRHKDEFVTGMYLTDKTIKVFFSIIAPGIVPAGLEIKDMARTIDIAPTLLDIAGLPVLKAQGRSLLPLINGIEGLPELDAFSQTGGMDSSPWKPDSWSVRTSRWKLVVTKKRKYFKAQYQIELYDLRNDPYELRDVSIDHPEIVRAMFHKLKTRFMDCDKTAEDFYRENGFDYEKYLKSRIFRFGIRWKVFFLTLLKYKLYYRPKTQIGTLVRRFKKIFHGGQNEKDNKIKKFDQV